MLVVLLEKVPTSLRGKLSRWLIEPKTGILLGNPSARVRDKLWEMIEAGVKSGGAIMIWSHPCPQGYQYRQLGNLSRCLEDYEGLALIRMAEKGKKKVFQMPKS